MYVVKRNGNKEPVHFEKVQQRIAAVSDGLAVDPSLIAQRVLVRLYNGVRTTELDDLAAQLAISLCTTHHDYGTLAARIAISNHQRSTEPSFLKVVEALSSQVHPKTGEPISYLSQELVAAARRWSVEIEAALDHERDFLFDYFGFKTLEKSYLLKSAAGQVLERPQHLWMRVAIALWPADFEKAKETYDLMSRKSFTHATPTLFNAGTPNQQLSSCFLQAMKGDSIDEIYNTLHDCAMISKYSGGIGLHIHDIRARGSIIRGTNGTSNGLIPMLKVFNSTARYCDQGGGRRPGSFAVYLEPWHADVEDFLRLKLNTGSEEERARDLFYALWVPDLFMERVEAAGNWTLFCPAEAPGLADVYGSDFKELYERYEREGRGRKTVAAQDLWFQILATQTETGTPYLCYKDAVNMKSNQKNLGVIKSSNLCVAPETYILTDKGQVQISSLEGQKVNVWNGNKWSETTINKTGESQKLITVYLSNGGQITCTPYHKFIISESYHEKKTIKSATRVDAADLKVGTKLFKFNLPTINFDESMLHPYTHGFFCGDGTVQNGLYGGPKNRITLYGEKKKLINHLEVKSSSFNETAQGTINVMIPDEIKEKYYVPIDKTIKCRLEWLAGLLDSDGTVSRNGTNEALQIASIHYDFLDRIRLMLQTLGVNAKVSKCHDERITLMPDGKGGRKEYNCKPLWRILISSSGLNALSELGLKCNRLIFSAEKPQRNAEQFVYVVQVVDEGRVDDTFCFNEPENHAGVFNGILTGNCTEIMEYSAPDETAVCNLASIGLPYFIGADGAYDFDGLRRVVATVIRNLDRVIDINFYPTLETRRSNMRHRPVGLGVQGLADVFALMRVPWDSAAAADLNQRIFEHIYYAAVATSAALAQELGPYESFQGSPASKGELQPDLWLKKPLTEADGSLDWATLRVRAASGLRNSLLVAPMPTASTSQILGYNECIEPFTSNIYSRRTLAGEFIVINKYLLNDLMRYGLWTEELKQKIIAQNGSVQALAEIPMTLQNLYRTAWELKQRTLIDMAADRGAFICQSQSLNLFVQEPTNAKLTSMHFHAWRCGLKTGIYYLRTRAPVMAQKFTVDPELQAAVIAAQRAAEPEPCLTCSA